MKPLNKLNELLNWKSDVNCNFVSKYEKPLFQKFSGSRVIKDSSSNRNKILLCHDMQGGYKDDALNEKNEEVYAYRFYHWHLIDIFVYFSHHFVTIPPIGWIYHSHRNGVQCLGTFIIENDSERNNFSCFLNLDQTELVAQKLTEIKNFYNFDGWLINIEVGAEKNVAQTAVNNIRHFLNLLVKFENEVHWYDSITKEGDLQWQNGLTELNKPFYDSCGNIFLNYCWNEQSIKTSIELAEGKLHNIFVGIDCFGRGCYGGGGLKCNLALEYLENLFKDNRSKCISKFSIALFAPGWCYENTENKQRDLDNQTWLFYNLMEKYLHPCLDGHTIYRQIPNLEINENNSFITNFDIGQGFSKFSKGVEILKGPYNFLMDQNFIPTGIVDKINSDLQIQIKIDRTISYSGHSCMVIVACKTATEIITHDVIIELFRMSCSFTKDCNASLLLILGWNYEPNIDIWNNIFLILNYSDVEGKIQSTEISLNTLKGSQPAFESNKVEWNIFKSDNLFSILGLKRERFTVLRISIKITGIDVFNYLINNKIYLGHLKLSC